LWPAGVHWEAECGHVVEGQGWGAGWWGVSANGTWEDGLFHVVQVAAHCVGVCCRTLVVLTCVSTCCTGVVVIDLTTIGEAVVPVLVPLNWQEGRLLGV
jgi:hypothetical protein